MSEFCDYMLSWFLEQYQNEEIPMSPEVYDRQQKQRGHRLRET